MAVAVILQHFLHELGSKVPIGRLLDLDHRGKGTAAQAGHFLHREFPFRISVLVIGNTQGPLQFVPNAVGPLDMTSSPWQTLIRCLPMGGVEIARRKWPLP